MKYVNRFQVTPGSRVKLKDIHPSRPRRHQGIDRIHDNHARLEVAHQLVNGRQVHFQAMDRSAA